MRNLGAHGIQPERDVHWDLPVPLLYEHTLRLGEGIVAHKGPLVVDSTPYTGRSPKDKYIVRESSTEGDVWWGDVNQPMEPETFDALYGRVCAYLGARDLYVQDLYAGADPGQRLGVRTISESPAHALFARNMFILPRTLHLSDEYEAYVPSSPLSMLRTSMPPPNETGHVPKCSSASRLNAERS